MTDKSSNSNFIIIYHEHWSKVSINGIEIWVEQNRDELQRVGEAFIQQCKVNGYNFEYTDNENDSFWTFSNFYNNNLQRHLKIRKFSNQDWLLPYAVCMYIRTYTRVHTSYTMVQTMTLSSRKFCGQPQKADCKQSAQSNLSES